MMRGPPIFAGQLKERLDMNTECCPKQDSCSKIESARLRRVCLCCPGIEPVESICARCEEGKMAVEGEPVLAA